MNTRESFRAAVERVRGYRPDSPDRRPAFGLRLPETHRACVEGLRAAPALPAPARPSAPSPREAAGAAQRVIRPAVDAIREGRETAAALVDSALAAAHDLDGTLRVFTHLREREARREAAALDAEAREGRLRGPLHGIPIAVKDVIHVAGAPTTASSRAMADVVAAEDAEAVRRLRAAGAVILGKTETHEFALGVTTPQSRNPWDPRRLPGGSSGGSAIAVATGIVPGALGTDTRASIRMPASLCGVVGLKPTFGLVSTWGVVTLSWSMDHVGPIAASVEDAALLLNVLAGHDPRDPASVERPADDFTAYLGRRVEGLTVAVPGACLAACAPDVRAAFARAMDTLRTLGVRVVPVDTPTADEIEFANAAGLIVSRAEAAAYHRERLASRGDLYTRDVFEQLDEARGLAAIDYVDAQRFRREFAERTLARLAGIDALAMPTAPVPAPKAEEAERYLTTLSMNCVPWSFVGLPALSLPCGWTAAGPQAADGLPIGLELVGPPFGEGLILALASAIETLHDPRAP